MSDKRCLDCHEPETDPDGLCQLCHRCSLHCQCGTFDREWYAADWEIKIRHPERDNLPGTIGRNDETICEMNSSLSPAATAAAQRLICSAPKLFKALRKLEWHAGNMAAALHTVGRETPKLDAALEEARTAITAYIGREA